MHSAGLRHRRAPTASCAVNTIIYTLGCGLRISRTYWRSVEVADVGLRMASRAGGLRVNLIDERIGERPEEAPPPAAKQPEKYILRPELGRGRFNAEVRDQDGCETMCVYMWPIIRCGLYYRLYRYCIQYRNEFLGEENALHIAYCYRRVCLCVCVSVCLCLWRVCGRQEHGLR